MDREDVAIALVLSVPVAAGVATGVLKQTLGSQPLVAAAAGLTAGGAVFGLVALAARRRGTDTDSPSRLQSLAAGIIPEPRETSQRDLLLGAGVGAVVTVFLWYIPLSPVLGGAAAGFVQGGTREDARTAGTLSGALVPVIALVVGLTGFLLFGATVFGRFPFGPAAAVGLAVVGIVYAVGMGTVGGWLGGLALRDERRWGNEV